MDCPVTFKFQVGNNSFCYKCALVFVCNIWDFILFFIFFGGDFILLQELICYLFEIQM